MSNESPCPSPLPPPPSPPPPEQVSIELEVNVSSYNPTTVVTTPVKETNAQTNTYGTIGRILSRARTCASSQLVRFAPCLGDYIVSNIFLLPLLILPSPFFVRDVDFFGVNLICVICHFQSY